MGRVATRVPPSWNETFMRLARVHAERSKDPGTQVGAVIAGADHRQLSAGYKIRHSHASPAARLSGSCRSNARQLVP